MPRLRTQYDPDAIYPFEVEVTTDESPLDEDSVVDVSQIRVIDFDRQIQATIGSLSAESMTDVDRAIRESLGL